MYGNSMHGVIYNIVRDHDISEEVMQDVFIKAWNNADSYSSEKGRFFTWILNIARNAAIGSVIIEGNFTARLNGHSVKDVDDCLSDRDLNITGYFYVNN